jgi:hypothetical protein
MHLLCSMQRVLEGTFQLDMTAARQFCAADDRWVAAVDFLDKGGGAGWDLIKVCWPQDRTDHTHHQ